MLITYYISTLNSNYKLSKNQSNKQLIVYTYFLIIICLTILLLMYIPFNYRSEELLFYGLSVILVCFAAFRPFHFDRDYGSYYYAFLNKNFIFEITYTYISKVIWFFAGDSPTCLFLIYAIIGVSLKFFAIKRYSDFWIPSVFIYVCYLYNLQELTGIRIGVACGFILLSIKPLCDRKIGKFVLLISLAALFHITSLVCLIFLFITPCKLNKLYWCLPIPIAYMIYFLNFNIFKSDFIQLFTISDYMLKKAYSYSLEKGPINIFNSWQIMRILFSYYFIYYSDILADKNKYSLVFIKIFIISTCILPLFSFSSTYSGRLTDIFMISDIILIPMILYINKLKFISLFLISFFGLAYFYFNVFFSKIFYF